MWTVYPCSVIVGGGSALLWVAEGHFITSTAAAVSHGVGAQPVSLSTAILAANSNPAVSSINSGASSIGHDDPITRVDTSNGSHVGAETNNHEGVLGLYSGIFMMAFALTQVKAQTLNIWPWLFHNY